jgi:hypothetical protein
MCCGFCFICLHSMLWAQWCMYLWIDDMDCPLNFLLEEFEDTKGEIRFHISKKNRQHNGQKKKYKKTNSNLQNIHIKDRVKRTPLRTGGEPKCCGRVNSSCSTSSIHHVNLVINPVISHEWRKDWEVFTTSVTYPRSFVTQDIP